MQQHGHVYGWYQGGCGCLICRLNSMCAAPPPLLALGLEDQRYHLILSIVLFMKDAEWAVGRGHSV
jgi:hypothetical protein